MSKPFGMMFIGSVVSESKMSRPINTEGQTYASS